MTTFPATTKHSVVEDVLGLLIGTLMASFGLFLLHASSTVTGGTSAARASTSRCGRCWRSAR